MATMKDPDIRRAVAQYLSGTLTEAEAARQAEIPRVQLREYARTCGIVASPPDEPKSTFNAEN